MGDIVYQGNRDIVPTTDIHPCLLTREVLFWCTSAIIFVDIITIVIAVIIYCSSCSVLIDKVKEVQNHQDTIIEMINDQRAIIAENKSLIDKNRYLLLMLSKKNIGD